MRLFLKVCSFILVTLLFSSCNCDKDCPDCHTLDEENCKCILDLACQCNDGIQNGNETGIDCGGDCDQCFDCMSNYCIFLTGATSDQPRSNIKWISYEEQDLPDDGTWQINFYNTGVVYNTYDGVTGNGSWEFDDPSDPTEIDIDYSEPPTGWPDSETIPVLLISTDTIGLHSGNWEYYFVKE